MIIASPLDYRSAAQRRLPRFLLDYIEGGAGYEQTLRSNIDDLQRVNIKQRILRNVGDLSLKTDLFGHQLAMPVAIAPIGLMGMCARRGEVQVAKAAEAKGIPFTMSTVSVCSIEEVQSQSRQPIWFQLYVLKDRKFMKNALERAWAAGIRTLVFTVDMPTPGSRYRDPHSGMSGPYRYPKRILQAMFKPAWALDVGLMGRPHDLGNISAYTGKVVGLEDYIGWLANNFDPTIGWSDLEWIREFWKGTIIIKGILEPQDARDAVSFGANGIVVSNHGGRQLDGAASSARALPAIADAVGNDLTILADSGIRSGLDIVRMLALGAKSVLLGRAAIYALATAGQSGVENLLDMLAKEMRVAMTLMGVNSVQEINRDNIFRDSLQL